MKALLRTTVAVGFLSLLSIPPQAFAQGKKEVFQKTQGSSPDSATTKVTRMKQSRVLSFDFGAPKKGTSARSLPKLNLGDEPQLNFAGLTQRLERDQQKASLPALPPVKNLSKNLPPTDSVFTKLNKQTLAAAPAKQIKLEMPGFQQLRAIEYPRIQTSNPQDPDLKNITKYSDVDLRILEAMILHEIRKEHEIGLGMMAEILNKNQSAEALYHYARMALAVGLNIEYRNKMLNALTHKKAGDYREFALKHLLQNPQPLEVDDIAMIDPLLKVSKEAQNPHPHFYLLQGKHYNRTGELKEALEALSRVDIKSPTYVESVFLQGIIGYKSGQLDRAITELEKVMDLTEKDPKANLRSLAAITLGRLYFQKAEFKKSFEAFRKVDRSHALWFEAMAEQAWAQVMIKDYEGAAGNMFSLHTDYFKNVYAPETFLIRSVGYLNLCQYGDGMRVLVELGKKYFPIKEKVDKFVKEKKDTTALYEKLKLWAKNPDLKEIEGLPTPLVVQSGRDPEFLSIQRKINQREDEIQQFNKMFLELIQGERQALKNENASLQSLYRQARSSLKYVRTNTINSLNTEIDSLKKKASVALNSRFQKLREQLEKVIDNHEILYYEVYSGAGEHLRYQTAGGKPNQEVRPELKGEKGKTMVWKFKGEIWEDEIGHYRSSLKSVCPEDQNENNAVVAEKQ